MNPQTSKFSRLSTTVIVSILFVVAVGIIAGLYWFTKSDDKKNQSGFLWSRSFMRDSLRLLYTFKPTTNVFKVFVPHRDNSTLFVQNWSETNVQRIDTAGNILQTFGRKGFGPGEFIQICNVSFSDQGPIIIDQVQMKISQFDSSGHILKSITVKEGFSNAIYITKNVCLLQNNNNGTAQEEYFRLLNLNTNQSELIKVPRLIPSKSQDPTSLSFEVAGPFINNQYGRIFRVSTNTGQFIAFDTSGRYLYSQYTIDRTPLPQVVRKSSGTTAITKYGEQSRSVNVSMSADERYLYILSNAATPMIAESRKGTNATAIIDMYSVVDGKYVSSIQVPSDTHGKQKFPDAIHVANGRLYVTVEHTIQCYLLPQQ